MKMFKPQEGDVHVQEENAEAPTELGADLENKLKGALKEMMDKVALM